MSKTKLQSEKYFISGEVYSDLQIYDAYAFQSLLRKRGWQLEPNLQKVHEGTAVLVVGENAEVHNRGEIRTVTASELGWETLATKNTKRPARIVLSYFHPKELDRMLSLVFLDENTEKFLVALYQHETVVLDQRERAERCLVNLERVLSRHLPLMLGSLRTLLNRDRGQSVQPKLTHLMVSPPADEVLQKTMPVAIGKIWEKLRTTYDPAHFQAVLQGQFEGAVKVLPHLEETVAEASVTLAISRRWVSALKKRLRAKISRDLGQAHTCPNTAIHEIGVGGCEKRVLLLRQLDWILEVYCNRKHARPQDLDLLNYVHGKCLDMYMKLDKKFVPTPTGLRNTCEEIRWLKRQIFNHLQQFSNRSIDWKHNQELDNVRWDEVWQNKPESLAAVMRNSTVDFQVDQIDKVVRAVNKALRQG